MPVVNLKNVRMVYAHLVEPRAAAPGADPKYSVAFLIPKEDAAQVEAVKAAAKEAKELKFGTAPVKGMRHPLRDGDEKDAETGEYLKPGAEFRGHYYLPTSSKQKVPVTITIGGEKRAAPAEHIVSGYYANATIKLLGFDAAGNRGVAAYVNGVHITKRGLPLGTAVNVDTSGSEDFGGATGDDDSIPFN